MADHDLFAAAFPTLSAEQVASLSRCSAGSPRVFADGERLFAAGERDFKFFVLLEGGVEIIDRSGGEPRRVAFHGPGEFTGDVGHLNGNPAIADAVARHGCKAIEIPTSDLRRVLSECPELSDVLLSAFIARRQILRQSSAFTGLRVIGSRHDQATFRVREFLARNRALFTWLDLETDPDVAGLMARFGVGPDDTPVVACGSKLLLRNPSLRELAEVLGIRRPMETAVVDLAVVGAGPAGLAAAVYAASEGLRVVVLERAGPGGQAGSSMRIENYLGFPTGITGAELTDRATVQASKFGARLTVPAPVTGLDFDGPNPVVRLDGGESVTARCLLIATGADYRRLKVPGCERFEGRGVYYAATPEEARHCSSRPVIVVGGGNSAGQAVVYLSGHAERVLVVVRGDDLRKSMSSYLARRIEQTANVELLCGTSVRAMEGDDHLASVELECPDGRRRVDTPALFSFIGAVPRTDWLPAGIDKDEAGFVRTGPDAARSPFWPGGRSPYLLETSRPGVFAAGDVRSGSVKRVASAVGEGSMAVQFVHRFLADG